MSEAGESCPIHGLEECGTYEDAAMTTGNPPLEEAQVEPMMSRLKTLAGFMVK